MKCQHCGNEIVASSKFYPLKYRKYCSRPCVQKAWLTQNRPSRIEQARRSHLKKKFGITPEEYDELYKKQCGRCAICKEKNEPYQDSMGRNRPTLYVDHHHESGVVRGLLCHGCNLGIGYLKDNPSILRSAIGYLSTLPHPGKKIPD